MVEPRQVVAQRFWDGLEIGIQFGAGVDTPAAVLSSEALMSGRSVRPSDALWLDRRRFVKIAGSAGLALAAGLGSPGCGRPDGTAGTGPPPDPVERELALLALEEARAAGASYADVRVSRHVKHSLGCAYAQDWASIPFQRMPNVSLLPGEEDLDEDDLIAAVDRGILIEGRGSYSIDQQRYNAQFGGRYSGRFATVKSIACCVTSPTSSARRSFGVPRFTGWTAHLRPGSLLCRRQGAAHSAQRGFARLSHVRVPQGGSHQYRLRRNRCRRALPAAWA